MSDSDDIIKQNGIKKSAELFTYIKDGEQKKADDLLHKWAKKYNYRSAMCNVLEPTLDKIGRLWNEGKISLAAGYLAGKVTEDILNLILLYEASIELRAKSKGTVVLGNIEDDYHSLGLRLITVFLRSANWEVINLGTDVTAEIFVDTAVEYDAHIIGASAMMLTTAQNILKVRQEIDSRGLADSIKLAVGGAIFKIRPELVAEIGGDGTATNAVDVPTLFDRLSAEVSK